MPVYLAEGEGLQTAISPVPGKLFARLRSADRGVANRVAKKHKVAYDDRMSKLVAPFRQFGIQGEGAAEDTGEGRFHGEPSEAFERQRALAADDDVEEVELDWLIYF